MQALRQEGMIASSSLVGGDNINNGASYSSSSLRRSIVWSDIPPVTSARDVLQDRLEELTVFELRRDGGEKRYLRMSVRSLYKYVLSAITTTTTTTTSLPLGRAMLHHPNKSITNSPGISTAAMGVTTADDSATSSRRYSPVPRGRKGGDHEGVTSPILREGGNNITYRERLGGYIHPRDMRRLVTPFVTSNEPEIIVRRHVMLLNFDPVRAIILRDRLLVLVPDGADELTKRLEKILKGEIDDVIEMSMAGKLEKSSGSISAVDTTDNDSSVAGGDNMYAAELDPTTPDLSRTGTVKGVLKKKSSFAFALGRKGTPAGETDDRKTEGTLESESDIIDPSDNDGAGGGDEDDDESEWVEMKRREWIDLPFELQCLDAVLLCVGEILSEDTLDVQQATREYIQRVVSQAGSTKQNPLSVLRALKDAVREMSSRVNGFVKSLTRVLDEDEDMALMNLSRLLTNPERFIQPVPDEILEEESDEPELILEANLQIGLSLKNALDLIDGQVDSTSDLVNRYLDSVRNNILMANVILTVLAVCIALASLVGSIFGMNLALGNVEDNPYAFAVVTSVTIIACIILFFAILLVLKRTGTMPRKGMGADAM